MTRPADYASSVEIHKPPRFRLNRDEWVAAVAIIALAFAVLLGGFSGSQPAPPIASCYQATPARR